MHNGLCDSHAHLTSSEIFQNVEEVIARAKAAGVNTIVNICTDGPSLEEGLKLSSKHSWIFNAAAVHPHDSEKEGSVYFPLVEQAARKKQIVAIGEAGLDYHYEHSKHEIQQEYLRKHLRLALELQLPVIIHCREAYPDFFRILDEEYRVNGKYGPGVLHCFTGTLEEAKQGLDRGFYISFSGIVTFKKSEALREVVKIVPIDRLLIETDAPYLAPQSKRGKANEPSFIGETAEVVANVRGISAADLIAATTSNTKTLFAL